LIDYGAPQVGLFSMTGGVGVTVGVPRNGVKYFNAEVNKVDPKVCLHCSFPSGCHAKGKSSLDICWSLYEERLEMATVLINFLVTKMRQW